MSLSTALPLARRRRPLLWALAALVLAGGGFWLWASGLFGLGLQYLNMRQTAADWHEKGIWLPYYTAQIEAQPVVGVDSNLSGLTWAPESDTLFAVINRPPGIAELSKDGALLRLIPLIGAVDPEGISHVEGTVFVISDEARQSLNWVVIGPEASEINLAGSPELVLNYGTYHNMGFEGVSWDSARDELFIAQEMLPIRVLRVRGLTEAIAGEGFSISVTEWAPGDRFGHFTTDLSSLSAHDATGNLLLLSDMTGALAEYAPDGSPVSVMPLWSGWHGLRDDVPQAEGLAVDARGDIYIVSEPNLFYRFSRDPAPVWAE
ncbi:SdiA-regulated domain-containing protein [Pseudomonas sp. GX19020]|uniref:SdiA-regulated domain-containing protein n=1 Tax=Pseudomonas sp. GX19020 TaxID=2942277 RepID=UPI0020191AF0|nr:SdiA-regulated domain-containing protein [Pseudomonas sp. GX19020]MCL4066360.1 SdiA-regulated domain-containing protein [Pseudomonas sp. GX19020]